MDNFYIFQNLLRSLYQIPYGMEKSFGFDFDGDTDLVLSKMKEEVYADCTFQEIKGDLI